MTSTGGGIQGKEMKRSLHVARRARPMSRAVWWASSGVANKSLAQRYGDGRRVTTQPFQRSVTDVG